MSERKRLVVIDGKSVFYRGYYAMPGLSTKDGTPTGGVFGFATMALEVIKQLKPDYVCVAWDKPKTNIRRRLELYPQYKAGRKPPPKDFYDQIPILHELLEAFGWPLYEFDDYEADDIMGTLAVQATEQNIETILVTSDLDMLQLIDSHVSVYVLKKGLSNIEQFHPEAFVEKYGLQPSQFLDLKSLKGDSSDNIPGVPGVGEKTAIELLKQYATLDGVYENLALVKESVQKKLVAGKDSAYLSKQLAAIWTDAPVKLDLKEVDGSKCDPESLRDLLQKLEFRTLVQRVTELWNGQVAPVETHSLQGARVVRVTNAAELLGVDLGKGATVAVHARCAGRHGQNPQTLLISPSSELVYALDLTKLKQADLVATLAPQLEAKHFLGHELKATIKAGYHLGLNFEAVGHDTLVGAFLIDSLRREQTLSALADEDLHLTVSLENLTPEEYVERSGEITKCLWLLRTFQHKQLQEMPRVEKLAAEIEWPIIPVLARMEYEGVALNSEYLGVMSKDFEKLITQVEEEVYEHAGQKFNIGSPSQLSKVLFEDMGLPTQGIKKGKSAYSTAANELDKLRWTNPIINLITQYREYTKLKSTYVDALPRLVDSDGRLRTDFRLTIAQTGRLSSADPNLQNIPVRTEIGKKIRDAFVAGKGRVLVSADYSQFELRLAAALAKDQELIELFNHDTDIHTATAAQVYGIKDHEVTPDQRRHAKVINFGILYGMSVHGLAVATGMNMVDAKSFLDKYKALRKPLFDYTSSLIELAKNQGFVETLHGRRRPMPDITSSNFVVRAAAERAAMNMPIQGTEADLMKLAMIRVDQELPEGAKQLLQIHDSIMVECDESQADQVAELLISVMETVYTKLPVKLKVDIKTGKTWGDL